jgi:hypothetical protein
MMNFEIISEITDIEPIAVNNDIRDIQRIRKAYGKGKWRKLKGIALIHDFRANTNNIAFKSD